MADENELRDLDGIGVLAGLGDADVLSFNTQLGLVGVLHKLGAVGPRDAHAHDLAGGRLLRQALNAQAEEHDLLLALHGVDNLRVGGFHRGAVDIVRRTQGVDPQGRAGQRQQHDDGDKRSADFARRHDYRAPFTARKDAV